MQGENKKKGQIAVIFVSQRNNVNHKGYCNAAGVMEALAKKQPGYAGIVSARDIDGLGITVSYWESEAAAKAWRAHPVHSKVREQGRELWYDNYQVDVATVERSYEWVRDADAAIG